MIKNYYFSTNFLILSTCFQEFYNKWSNIIFFINLYYYYYLLSNNKKVLKIFSPKTWCTKKPFGYRVAHLRYLLTSCLGHITYIIFHFITKKNLSSYFYLVLLKLTLKTTLKEKFEENFENAYQHKTFYLKNFVFYNVSTSLYIYCNVFVAYLLKFVSLKYQIFVTILWYFNYFFFHNFKATSSFVKITVKINCLMCFYVYI